jgi:L-iditol 2-dehydrogenase
LQAGDSVAIIGSGNIGIIHIALSKIFGAAKVIASDLIDYRLNIAKKFGADVTVNPQKEDLSEIVKAETGGRGVDVAFITAPSLEAYKTGLALCRKGGKFCVFAPTEPKEKLQLSPKDLFFSEIQIIPSYSTSHLETRLALELIKSGRLKLKELITHRFRLEEASEAFKTATENKESLKVIIVNQKN